MIETESTDAQIVAEVIRLLAFTDAPRKLGVDLCCYGDRLY